ncbi:hypothetical protein GYB57_04350 [bacterium]|nr:hypothetical protein [bacterium]
MNRLVLIGNGYDIAAGLPTSYEDFLVDYFKGAIRKCAKELIKGKNKAEIDDEWIKVVGYYEDLTQELLDGNLKKIDSIESMTKPNKMVRFTHLYTKESWEKGIGTITFGEANRFDVTINSHFLKELLGDYNWRDIESFYFKELVKIYDRIKEMPKLGRQFNTKETLQMHITHLKDLNANFECLRIKIVEYLCKVNTSKTGPLKFIKKLKEPMEKTLFNKFFQKGKYSKSTNAQINEVKFVNFNYTFGLENAFKWSSINGMYSQNDILYIHGYTHEREDIIFGYGDDTDPIFKELELTGEDEFLKHLKSFKYPLNGVYIELINFLEYEQFEVVIVGHSLGISDRVLLKTIFEHDHCKAIRFLHRGRDDEKQRMDKRYMALARHFDNKMIMRNKIVSFDINDKLN